MAGNNTIQPPTTDIGIIQRQPTDKNLLLSTHYKFQCLKIPNTTYFCQAANVPGVSIKEIKQDTPFNPVVWAGGVVEQEKLNIKFVVDEDLKNWIELFNWTKECSDYENFTEYKSPSIHLNDQAHILIHTSSNNPNFKVSFNGIFPLKLGGIKFDARENQSDFIYCECEFALTTFKIEAI